MIQVDCLNCGEPVVANEWFSGQSVTCQSCGCPTALPALTTPPIVNVGDEPVALVYAGPAARSAPYAVASVLCGLLGLAGIPVFLVLGVAGMALAMGIVLAPLAIIFGGLAERAYKNNPDTYSGKGLIAIGQMLGWITVIVLAPGSILYLVWESGLV